MARTPERLRRPLRVLRPPRVLPPRIPSAIATTAIALAVVVIAGCASTASPARDHDAAEAQARELRRSFRQPVPATADTLVYRGVSLSVPVGYRFEGVFGANLTSDSRPQGVLFRFRDEDARVSGSVQLVPVPGETDPSSFIRRYLDERLDAADDPVIEVPGHDGPVPAAIVPFPEDETNREILVTLVPLSSTLENRYALLLEAVYPGGDDDLRGEVASIAASLEVPRTREALRKHGRRYADGAKPRFSDESGRWQWVGDVPGGFALRLSEAGRDLYVLITEPVGFPAEDLRDSGMHIEVSRGPWSWVLPVASTGADDRTLYLVVPPDPLRDQPARALLALAPAQAWRDGRYVGTSDFDLERTVVELQQLVSDHLIVP